MRARRTPNVAQMAQALSFPGIDPRRWCDQGVAVSDPVREDGGTYIDVRLDSGGIHTCRISQAWSGIGSGSYVPIEKDDQVACIIPGGNPRSGVIVLGAMSNAVDTIDADAVDNPLDYRFTFKDGRKVVFKTLGSKSATLTFDDGSVVLVNSDGATVALDAANHRVRIMQGATIVDVTANGLTIVASASTISGSLAMGSATVGGDPAATVGMPIAINADWLTWLTALATTAGFATPAPSSPIGLTGV